MKADALATPPRPARHLAAATVALTAALTAGVALAAGEEAPCPRQVADRLAGMQATCVPVAEGGLASGLGNADVLWRLYSWTTPAEADRSALYAAAPYNQTAVTLQRQEDAGGDAFWADAVYQGVAWFETPYLARHPQYGEFLVVPGRYAGTGSFTEDHVFMPNHGRGWTEIAVQPYDPESGRGWIAGLKPHLPPGHGIWKGIRIDYATLTGTSPVWRDGDANCCPSGGEISFRLRVAGPEPHLEVAEARYTPP